MSQSALLKKILTRIYNLYEKELDEHKLNMWLGALEGHKIDHVQAAFRQYLKQGIFVPMPAQILQLISELKSSQPAFVEFKRGVYRDPPHLSREYETACQRAASHDRVESKAGYAEMQRLRPIMDELYRKNWRATA